MHARMWKEKAEQADEKASQKIFDSRCVLEVAIKQTCYLHMHIHLYVDIVIECRNKYNIVDLMTINLHGQHLKEGMTILKYHLAFALRRLRVITGYGRGGTGQSMLKQAVVDLLKVEKFERERKRRWYENETNMWPVSSIYQYIVMNNLDFFPNLNDNIDILVDLLMNVVNKKMFHIHPNPLLDTHSLMWLYDTLPLKCGWR
uniref:Smr domain-containing protein n=1 Tax=Lactuca sativa TaxID=4236 RepID=A0A9R1XE99_LACSA|nr:hypothetical protein LSAT_V11C400222440 [Lactuca sativa]